MVVNVLVSIPPTVCNVTILPMSRRFSLYSSFVHTLSTMIEVSHAFCYGIQRETVLSINELTNPGYLVAKLRFVIYVD